MDNRADSPDLAEARRTFEAAGLVFPTIPGRLVSKVRRLDNWLYGSRAVIPLAMYMLEPYVLEAIHSKAPEYVAIGHLGHGVNSYAITYQLVYGRLACFMQTAWGGVYGDRETETTIARGQLQKCAELAVLAKQRAASDERLIVVDSPYSDVGLCEWLSKSLRGTAVKAWFDSHRNSCSTPLDAAIELLSNGKTDLDF